MEGISTERSGRRLDIWLDRPERRNAIVGPMAQALAAAVTRAGEDDDIGAILLRGRDDAFCSGLDLKAFAEDPPPAWRQTFSDDWRAVHEALFACPKPVVVALQKFAINGGAALALAGDLLVAGESAFLQVGEVRQGVPAPMNIAWLIGRYSVNVANQLTLTGDRFDGAALKALGIAYACVGDDEVINYSIDLADRLAEYPANGVAEIKAAIRNAAGLDAGIFAAAQAGNPLRSFTPERVG